MWNELKPHRYHRSNKEHRMENYNLNETRGKTFQGWSDTNVMRIEGDWFEVEHYALYIWNWAIVLNMLQKAVMWIIKFQMIFDHGTSSIKFQFEIIQRQFLMLSLAQYFH